MTNLRTVSKHPEQLETTPLVAESHHYDDPLAPQKTGIFRGGQSTALCN